jgi:hypothetical protein
VLSLFRNNQFFTAFLLALYVVLTHLSALLGKVEAPSELGADGVVLYHLSIGSGVLYQAWFGWAEANPFWSAMGAVVLVFVQALAVNILADEFRLLSDRNWMPGMFYALVTAAMPSFLFLSPPLVATTFLPMILRRLFRAYNQPKATALVFDAAFWTTVASLFYPPATFLLLAVYFGFSVMRSYSFRERMVSLAGVTTALFLAWLWYFWTDRGLDFWKTQFGDLIGLYGFRGVEPGLGLLVKAGLLTALVVTAILSYGTYMSRKLIQTQKCVSVLYLFFFIAGFSTLLQNSLNPAHFMLMMPALGIFMAMSFSEFRKPSMAEFFHLMILGAVFFIQLYPKLELPMFLQNKGF